MPPASVGSCMDSVSCTVLGSAGVRVCACASGWQGTDLVALELGQH